MKHRIGSILSLIILSLVFSFFNGCKPQGQKTTTLSIWETYNDEEHEVFMRIVSDFQKKNPGFNITVQRVPFRGIEQKVLTAIAGGIPPDIARIDVAFTSGLVSKGAVVPLFPEELGPLTDQLLKEPLKSNIIRDTLFGLPDQTTCVVLFYRKDLYKKYGVDKPPATWDEFVTVAKKLTHPDQGIFGFGMHNSLWWTFPFIFSFGGGFLSPDLKESLLDHPGSIAGFKFKVDLYRKHKVEAGAWRPGAVTPDIGFRNGKYAMMLSGPWSIKSLIEANVDFGIAPIPEGPAGSHSIIGGTNIAILNPEKKEPALKFLKYLLSPEVQAFWANELGQIPINVKAFPMVDTLRHPYLPVLIKTALTAYSRPATPFYAEIEILANQEMELALSGKKSPEEVMRTIDRRIEQEILAKYVK